MTVVHAEIISGHVACCLPKHFAAAALSAGLAGIAWPDVIAAASATEAMPIACVMRMVSPRSLVCPPAAARDLARMIAKWGAAHKRGLI